MAGGTVMGRLALWAPVPLATQPANDNFANAQALGPGLPIELSTTNVEATKEEGGPYHGIFGSKGHSVWFKWEATFTGLVVHDRRRHAASSAAAPPGTLAR